MDSVTSDIPLAYGPEIHTNSWNDSYLNLGQLCRICGSTSEFLMPIFEGEGLQHHLDQKIHIYLHLQLLRNGMLPLQVCFDCVSTILSWHTLYLKCQESDRKFHILVGPKDQVQLPDRSIVISTQETSKQLPLPPHRHMQANSTVISQNSLHAGRGPSALQHMLLSGETHRSPNNSSSTRDTECSDSPPLSFNLPTNYNAQRQDVLGLTSSEVPSTIFENIPDASVSEPVSVYTNYFTNAIHIDQHGTLSHVKICKEDEKKGKFCDEYGSNSTKNNLAEKVFTHSSFLEYDGSSSNISGMKPSAPSPTKATQEVSPILERESAIRSTSNTDILFHQDNSLSRSKSVLVRNECVMSLVPSNEGTDRNTFFSSGVARVSESSVIREHPHGGRSDDMSKSTMVSVVRPTCLRRAPTAVVVIENIGPDCHSGFKNTVAHPTVQLLEEFSASDRKCDNGGPTEFLSSRGEDRKLNPSHLCFYCKKFIHNSVLLLAHEKSHLSDPNPPTNFTCKFCSRPQNSLAGMHLHYTSHEAVEKFGRGQCNRKVLLCKQCGLMCTTEERLAIHQRAHTDHVEFFRHECRTCGEAFSTRNKLSVHLWTHALKSSLKFFKCHICGKGFGTKPAVMEHRLKHTDEERSHAFKCVVCGMAFSNNTLLGKHRSTHSKEELARPFVCTFCGKAFARNHTLQIHHLSHSNEKSHLCSHCGKGFKMRNSLIQHMRTHQDPRILPSYPCHLCSKSFKVKSRLRDHLRVHSGDKPYNCITCGKRFHKVHALHTHEVSHREERPYKCNICEKSFKWSKNLSQHQLVHVSINTSKVIQRTSTVKNEEKGKIKRPLYQCKICGRQFSGKSSLQQHMNNDHVDGASEHSKLTVCSICGKELSRPAALVRHMRNTHGGLKPFKCDMCNREYSTKVARDDHRRSHTGERPYSCNMCLKSFASLSNLHIHRATHSDDRPHKCSYCDKQFKRRAHLVPHLRIHTGEKPYVCEICSRGFAQSNDLHKHRLTHSNHKAYACCCGMEFRTKRDLTRHQSKHHPPGTFQPDSLQAGAQALSAINGVEKEITPRKQIILFPGQHSSVISSGPSQSFDFPAQPQEIATPSVVVRNSRVMYSQKE